MSTQAEEPLHPDIIDAFAPSPADLYDVREMNEVMTRNLARLTKKEAESVTMRFGLDGMGEAYFHEIGKHMGVCTPRAQQVFEKGMRKLRHPSRSRHLSCFLPTAKTWESPRIAQTNAAKARQELTESKAEAETAKRRHNFRHWTAFCRQYLATFDDNTERQAIALELGGAKVHGSYFERLYRFWCETRGALP